MQPKPAVERRKRNIPAATDRRNHHADEGKPEPAVPLTDEASAFMAAMERYKRDNRRPFPTWSEVLEVLRSLGYRKVGAQIEVPATDEAAGMDPKTTPATIDRRQKDVPVAHDRRHFGKEESAAGEEPPLPPKG